MAFAAIGALIAGEAVTATLVLSAATEIGLAMTVVGAVTGEKSLMKLGGVLSLVGGVGGMIAGAAGGAASAAGAAEVGGDAASLSAADAAGGLVPEFGTNAAYAAGLGDTASLGASLGLDSAAGFEAGGDITSLTSEASKALDLTPSFGDAASESPDFLKTMGDAPEAASTPAQLEMPEPAAPPTPSPLIDQGQPVDARNGSDVMSDNFDASTANNAKTAGGFNPLPSADSKGFFGDFLKWVNQNKTVANGIMTLAGGAMKGASDRSMFDEKMALERAKYGHGNEVAGVYKPQPLIGAPA